MTRKKIGIISGPNTNNGIYLWQRVLHHNKILLKDGYKDETNAPNVTIFSVPELGKTTNMLKNYSSIWQSLQETINQIILHVNCFAIASATLATYEDDIGMMGYDDILISPVKSSEEYFKKNDIKDFAILGEKVILEMGRFSAFKRLSKKFDIEIPDIDRMTELLQLIDTNGVSSPIVKGYYNQLIQSLKSDNILIVSPILSTIETTSQKNFVNAYDLMAQKLAIKGLYI